MQWHDAQASEGRLTTHLQRCASQRKCALLQLLLVSGACPASPFHTSCERSLVTTRDLAASQLQRQRGQLVCRSNQTP